MNPIYQLTQKYYGKRIFSAKGTLEELATILTAGGGEILYLDASHYGPGKIWEEPAEGYINPGWYYKIYDDSPYHEASSLEEAVRIVGAYDTSEFSLVPEVAPTTLEITDDIEAFMERDGAHYTGNLIVRSEKLDDYDIYRLNSERDWEITFNSLTNKSDKLDLPYAASENSTGLTSWLWEKVEGFAAWAEQMKALVPSSN